MGVPQGTLRSAQHPRARAGENRKTLYERASPRTAPVMFGSQTRRKEIGKNLFQSLGSQNCPIAAMLAWEINFLREFSSTLDPAVRVHVLKVHVYNDLVSAKSI